jgi:hypothetical protein
MVYGHIAALLRLTRVGAQVQAVQQLLEQHGTLNPLLFALLVLSGCSVVEVTARCF